LILINPYDRIASCILTIEMKLRVNGEEFKSEASKINLKDFLVQNGYELEYIAIAVNLNFIPKSDYDLYYLNEGDDLEILTPMQGG
jgi:sulfur carrier protein